MEGYPVKQYDVPVKRYCQTLEIEGDPDRLPNIANVTTRFGPRLCKEYAKWAYLKWRYTFVAPECS